MAVGHPYFSGGTIFMTKLLGFSVEPNGPGTLFFTDGTLRITTANPQRCTSISKGRIDRSALS